MESKTEIVEKRVKSTIIRRRAKVEEKPIEEPSKQEEVLASAEPSSVVSKEEVVEIKKDKTSKKEEDAKSVAPSIPEQKIPSKATIQPKPVDSEDDRPKFGLKIVGRMELPQSTKNALAARSGAKQTPSTEASKLKPFIPATPLTLSELALKEEENKKSKLKKVVKKGKKEELEVDIDGIGKVATLTQLTRLASVVTPERVERERVFEPTRSGRKKKSHMRRDVRQTEITTKKASKRIIKMDDTIVISDLAHEMGIKSTELIKKLMGMGSMVTLNQSIDYDTALIIAQEFGYEVKKTTFEESDALLSAEDKPEDLIPRPPVVTVMGHVDHGKTSLLDAIRKTQVAAGEAGGITQHIGAYRVKVPKGSITFLDTPGHAAFTSMRARGASVTDIVILVVAADDGVMPQTVEAIHHAKAAEVPIIVALNKIDKPGCDPEKVKRQLAENQLVPEEWGGDTIFAPVSAKTLQGTNELLELILLQAEVLELKANPKKQARGIVIESKLDRGKGPIATVLIQEGTLKTGDSIIAGSHFGRVRAMVNDQRKEIQSAGPSDPVEVIGLSGVPNAGEVFYVMSEEKMTKKIAEVREEKERNVKLASSHRIKLEDLFNQIQKGEVRELRIVLKGDVQGSIEALKDSLTKLSNDKVRVNILHSGAGGITESDVMLASASQAIVIGFNVRPDVKAKDTAASEKVEIKTYDIIYNAIEEIKKGMEGLLEPTYEEKYLGRAEVRNVFTISKVGAVAGSFVQDGMIPRGSKVRLLRDNVVVYNGKLSSLKRFKDDAKEVAQGYECGITLENFNDIKVGDVIEAYRVETIAGKL